MQRSYVVKITSNGNTVKVRVHGTRERDAIITALGKYIGDTRGAVGYTHANGNPAKGTVLVRDDATGAYKPRGNVTIDVREVA